MDLFISKHIELSTNYLFDIYLKQLLLAELNLLQDPLTWCNKFSYVSDDIKNLNTPSQVQLGQALYPLIGDPAPVVY